MYFRANASKTASPTTTPSQTHEPLIRYNGDRSKWAYIILVLLIVTLGHIIPAFGAVPDGFVYLTLIPMVLLAWFGYEMFAVGYTLNDRLEAREKWEEAERLAEATRGLAARGYTEAETDKLRAQTELAREKRLAAEADARREEAAANKAASYTERARIKQAQPAPVSSRKATTSPKKSWRDYGLGEIDEAVKNGAEPAIRITGKPVEQRYQVWLDVFGDGSTFTKSQALEHFPDISNSTFLNDMKALRWNNLVEIVDESQGIYRFIGDPIHHNGNIRV